MLRYIALLGVVSGTGGCVERPTESNEEVSSSTAGVDTGTTTAGTPGNTSGTTGSSEAVDVDTSGGGSSSDDGFGDDGWPCGAPGSAERLAHCLPDSGGVSFECDVLAQDCPPGDKCLPWANDGGAAWNATRCDPVSPAADPVGAPCLMEGSAVSGIDSCVLGAMCWGVDPIDLEGVCVAICSGNEADRFCEDPDTQCLFSNEGAIALCLPVCDPLLQDCTDDALCVPNPTEDAWVCVPPGSDALGSDGDPCEYLNVCTAGSVCATAEAVPGCEGSIGCCTSMCELGGEACAAPGTECVSWYEPGMSPPSLELLGICAAVPETPADGWVHPSVDHVRSG
jgi:hypothetical protein